MTDSESGEKRKNMSENKIMGINNTQEKIFPVKSKVLAVLGSPGSGKTTTSIKLALELAKYKKNTVIVFCDPFTSVIPYVIPAGTETDISLGMLLTAPGLTQTDILEACIPVSQSEYISLLGYKGGESLMAYPKITKDKTLDFFVMLRHLADYVIIDCSAVFEADPVSIIGIETADTALRLGTADLKGISYYQSHMPMLADSVFRSEGHLKAVSVKPGQEWEAAAQQYGGADFVLPFVPELEKQLNEVSLFEPLTSKESQPYNAEMQKIIEDIYGFKCMPVKTTAVKKERKTDADDTPRPTGKSRVRLSIKLPFGSFGRGRGEF